MVMKKMLSSAKDVPRGTLKHTAASAKPRKSHDFVDNDILMQKARMKLPVMMMEQEIVESVIKKDVVIICGPTGCGKSTQVPRFLYDAGFCEKKNLRQETAASTAPVECSDKLKICVTQPRRVAAIAVSQRVATEMNDPRIVGYEVRYDRSRWVEESCIKFVTDGILLKEIQSDFLCRKFSVIILDEAHERSVNCDILIGLLSRVVKLRREAHDKGESSLCPLKLVIMSATLKLCDFIENKNLFPIPPPVLNIETPTHPVTIHFSKHTNPDYILAANEKVLKIHKKLPRGSILVFVSGRMEAIRLCFLLNGKRLLKSKKTSADSADCDMKKLKTFAYSTDEENVEKPDFCGLFDSEDEEEYTAPPASDEKNQSPVFPIVEECEDEKSKKSKDFFEELYDIDPWEKEKIRWLGCDGEGVLRALPLYATLSKAEQEEAFGLPEDDERRVIVATNVAETSITLPNIRYVVDTGKEKRQKVMSTNVANASPGSFSYYQIRWISKASANQRSGRCGRLGPGHCYRLYSSAVYNNIFDEFPMVNILETMLDSVLLSMSSLGVQSFEQFPFPNPPDKESISQARKRLLVLGAIEPANGGFEKSLHIGGSYKKSLQYLASKQLYKCTKLGEQLSVFPLAPRYSRMLVASIERISQSLEERSVLSHCCMIVASLTVGNILDSNKINAVDDESHLKKRKRLSSDGSTTVRKSSTRANLQFDSDLDAYLWMCGGFAHTDDRVEFCKQFGINMRQISEAMLLADQLARLISRRLPILGLEVPLKPLPPTNSGQVSDLRKCVLEGLVDQIAIKLSLFPETDSDPQVNRRVSYKCSSWSSNQQYAHLHPSSYASHSRPLPEFVAYNQAVWSNGKLYLLECFAFDPAELCGLNSPLVAMNDILSVPPPMYSSTKDQVIGFCSPRYIPLDFTLSTVEVEIPDDNILKYKAFAKAFIEGAVFHQLKPYSCYLICSPSHFMQATHILATKFIHCLQKASCASRRSLSLIWKQDPQFLLSDYLQLLTLEDYNSSRKVQKMWPLT